MIRTHWLPVFEPHPTNPKIIGWNVWAYIGHPLLGQINDTLTFCETIAQRRKAIKELSKLRVV